MQIKYLIIKSKRTDLLSAGNSLPVVDINVYAEKWTGLNPLFDDLIIEPIIDKDLNRIKITGKKIHFSTHLGKYTYSNKYLLLDETKENKEKYTVADIIAFVKYKSANKLILKPEEIKLCYSSFKNWFFNKKTFYVDTTIDVISKLEFIEPSSINEINGKFSRDSSCQMTITSDFIFETTNYNLKYNN